MRRPQFSLKTLLWLMVVVAALSCAASFILRLQARFERFYDGFRKASVEARAHGKELSYSEWCDMYEAEMAKQQQTKTAK